MKSVIKTMRKWERYQPMQIIGIIFLVICVNSSSPISAQIESESKFRDLLEKATIKSSAQEWDEAAKVWESVVEINPVEGRHWKSLAIAHINSHNYRKAITVLQQVLILGGDVPSITLYNTASCYARLGDKANALAYLEKAFSEGYPHLERARNDDAFRDMRGDGAFQRIVGITDASKLSRVDGWRFDLALLAKEVARKGYGRVPRKFPLSDFRKDVNRISKSVPKLTDLQISIEIMKLMVRLGDGHTALQGSKVRPELNLSIPVHFYLFQEGLFITAAAPKYKDLLGAKIVRYGEHGVEDVLKAFDPLVSRDNEMQPKEVAPMLMRFLALGNGLGLIPDTKNVSLTVMDPSGKLRTVELTVDDTSPYVGRVLPKDWVSFPQTIPGSLPLYLKNLSPSYWYEHLVDSKTVYFQYNNVVNEPSESLAAFTDRLFRFIKENEVEKLVIDMRWNSGGNTFLNQPLLLNLIRNEKINQRGRLFVIIGRKTFSAAQNSITAFERYTNVIFVGEPSGSSPNFVGETTPFTLPYSKIQINVSNLYWASSSPLDFRTWIAPALYTPPTFQDYSTNQDAALEAALNYKAKP